MRKIAQYIKFNLPTGGAGMPAMMHRGKIARSIKEWADPRNVNFSYETEGYTFNVYFDSTADIAQFLMSYEPVYGKPRGVSY